MAWIVEQIFLTLKHGFETKVQASNLIKSKNISKVLFGCFLLVCYCGGFGFFLGGEGELNMKINLSYSINL